MCPERAEQREGAAVSSRSPPAAAQSAPPHVSSVIHERVEAALGRYYY